MPLRRPGDGAAATLDVHLTASAPTAGAFFAAGQQPVLTIRVVDRCGRVVPPSALGELKLYLAGPRAATLTKTASKLLNAVTNRAAADRQHHYVNLKSQSYADPARTNLAAQPDGAQGPRPPPQRPSGQPRRRPPGVRPGRRRHAG